MDSYSQAAMERAMKVREVILRALAKRSRRGKRRRSLASPIDRCDAGGSYEEHGYDELFDRGEGSRRRNGCWRRLEQVLGLYRARYFGLNVQHFHENLVAEHGMVLSFTWVKAALQGAGLVKRGRKRGVHRKRRPRRPLPGMLLHIDGNQHRWFQGERW